MCLKSFTPRDKAKATPLPVLVMKSTTRQGPGWKDQLCYNYDCCAPQGRIQAGHTAVLWVWTLHTTRQAPGRTDCCVMSMNTAHHKAGSRQDRLLCYDYDLSTRKQGPGKITAVLWVWMLCTTRQGWDETDSCYVQDRVKMRHSDVIWVWMLRTTRQGWDETDSCYVQDRVKTRHTDVIRAWMLCAACECCVQGWDETDSCYVQDMVKMKHTGKIWVWMLCTTRQGPRETEGRAATINVVHYKTMCRRLAAPCAKITNDLLFRVKMTQPPVL